MSPDPAGNGGLEGESISGLAVAEGGGQQDHFDARSCRTYGVLEMAVVGKIIVFPDYAPDVTPLGQAESQTIFNVVARSDGYGPVPSLQPWTESLPSACRGYFFARKSDGTIAIFAGTATDLYLMDNNTFAWRLVSKGSASYGTLVSTDNWSFAQFNDLVIACQANTVPQKYDLGSLLPAPLFVDLGGGPPAAASVSVIGFFVVLTGLTSQPKQASWSDLDAPETWNAGLGLADFQIFPDGGSCITSSGGDAYGMIFQEQAIRSMTYAAGNPAIFQFYRISTQEALYAKYSVQNIGNIVFYLGAAGFKMIVGTGDPKNIGKERVDRTFFSDVDKGNLQLVIAATDPTSTRVYFAYKSISGNTGLFDRVLAYDYALDKWTRLNISGEYMASLAKPGLTLEQLDAIAPQQLLVTNAVNNGSGLIRLTLTATSNAYFNIAGQNFIEVQGVVGTGGLTAAANGSWKPNIIDSTHIDLVGSAFVGAYTSGGAIGGSLDALGFSLDSIAKANIAQLSAFGPTNALGFFNGVNLEALLETSDADGDGKYLFTDIIMPITDATQVYCSVGWRNSPQMAPSYTTEQLVDDQGQACFNPIELRFQRGRVRIVAGTAWTFVRGIHPNTQLAGDR